MENPLIAIQLKQLLRNSAITRATTTVLLMEIAEKLEIDIVQAREKATELANKIIEEDQVAIDSKFNEAMDLISKMNPAIHPDSLRPHL